MAVSSPDDLVAKASFVFRGTVQQLNAATLAEVSDKSKTAIVRVDQTIHAPKALSHYDGRDITVQLADPAGIKAGDQAVFFTNAWLFGNEGVAVQSLGHHPPGVEAMVRGKADPVTNLEDRRIRAHYESSETVVTGKVTSVRLTAEAGKQQRTSEHDPQWREAIVQVSRRHKGTDAAGEIIVRFPASTDRAWHRVPKLHAGDEGNFLLHKPVAGTEYYTLLHPEDFERESHPGPLHRLLTQ